MITSKKGQQAVGILAAIQAANFVADATQIEQLAAVVVEGQSADGTYLRVLLAHMQSRLGRGRARLAKADAETVLDSVHQLLYPAVQRGVGPEDLDAVERNRRSTFARSAASTIRYFVRLGGDVRQVDVATATKGGLRKAVRPAPERIKGESRVQASFRRATDALFKAAQALLEKGDEDDAAERINGLIDQLAGLLEPADEGTQASATMTTVDRPRARGGGAPAGAMLHRPAGRE